MRIEFLHGENENWEEYSKDFLKVGSNFARYYFTFVIDYDVCRMSGFLVNESFAFGNTV